MIEVPKVLVADDKRPADFDLVKTIESVRNIKPSSQLDKYAEIFDTNAQAAHQ